MSMVNKNIEILNGLTSVVTRDYQVDSSLEDSLKPNADHPLEQGEWLIVSGNKVKRPSEVFGDGTTATPPGLVMVWTQKGRADIRATKKVTCIIGGSFEVDVADSLVSGTPTVENPVTIKSEEIVAGSVYKAKLAPHPGDDAVIYGTCYRGSTRGAYRFKIEI